MSDKHGPNSWDAYLAVHERRLGEFIGHFIVEDRVGFTRTGSVVRWEGELLCADGIEIHVRKTQAVSTRDGRPWVQTVAYSFQVLVRREGRTVNLFRYDDAAHHAHPDPHHRHRYDEAGREILPVERVGREGWPTLGEVLDEAFAVWRSRATP